MEKVRIGIVGLGSMGHHHARYLLAEKVPRLELVAVADSNPRQMADMPGSVRRFSDAGQLFASGAIDAALITTPHNYHVAIGIAALAAGLHVMVEKPIAAHLQDAERLVQAPRRRRQVLASMFQMRTYQAYQTLRRYVQEGELGEVRRVNWTVTDWFRTQAYYGSSSWRATWRGEGGGVLINQCPHNLDLYQWIFGMPRRVDGFCRFGRYHEIEVEDDVTARFEHESGLHATFIASTGEAPGTNRLEIATDRGRVVYENGRISFIRNRIPVPEFVRSANVPTGHYPPADEIRLPDADVGGKHSDMMENFVEAILDGKPLVAPAAEGLNSLALANAILMSTWISQPVELPFDTGLYARLLQERIDRSEVKRAVLS